MCEKSTYSIISLLMKEYLDAFLTRELTIDLLVVRPSLNILAKTVIEDLMVKAV